MIFKGQIKVRTFNRLYLINGTSYDQSLYETNIVNNIIMDFQFTL